MIKRSFIKLTSTIHLIFSLGTIPVPIALLHFEDAGIIFVALKKPLITIYTIANVTLIAVILALPNAIATFRR